MLTLRTLTDAERTLAEQNYKLVERFLSKNRLPQDEWYDVVIFGYLRTVERWFREPKLYRYEFGTVAWQSMRSAVGSERRKQARRIKTVSLDDIIPGTDGMTYADIITEDNLLLTPYLT